MLAYTYIEKGKFALVEKVRPVLVEPTDAIIRVTMSSICSSDLHIKHGSVPRAVPGITVGHEMVGVVEEIGAEVTHVKPGDRVTVNVETFCGECFFCKNGFVNNCTNPNGGWALGCRIDGGQTEYVRVPLASQGLNRIPNSVTDEQALFVGIRSTFYRIATIAGQGLLIMLAGHLETTTNNIPFAWSITFMVLAGLFLALWAWHKFILPRPDADKAARKVSASTLMQEFWATFTSFFKKKQAVVAILFMLLYRLPEAQLAKMSIPFLIDPVAEGGLGLTTEQIGFVQGTVGIIGLTLGGILGGIAVSRHGLRRWLWPMVWAISIPDIVYVYLSYVQPASLTLVNACVFVEQFGYGFGFTAYMLYLIYFANGEHKTAHYAICTAFMALGMMIPGMAAGWLQEVMGYQMFFIWIMICTLATFGVTALLKIDPQFGKK